MTIPQWAWERARVCVSVCLLPNRTFVHLPGWIYLWIFLSPFLPPSLFLYFSSLSLSFQCPSPQISLLFINVCFNQAHFFANLGPKYCWVGQKFHKIVWKNPKELFGRCNIIPYFSQGPPHSVLGEFVNNFHKQ